MISKSSVALQHVHTYHLLSFRSYLYNGAVKELATDGGLFNTDIRCCNVW